MNLKLLLGVIVLCLSACAGPSVRGDLPESDLDALKANVDRDLKRTLLENGKEYCAELAETEEAKDHCTGDLEDALFTSNRDKDRARNTLARGIQRLKLVRNPCGFWEKLFRNNRCKVE